MGEAHEGPFHNWAPASPLPRLPGPKVERGKRDFTSENSEDSCLQGFACLLLCAPVSAPPLLEETY